MRSHSYNLAALAIAIFGCLLVTTNCEVAEFQCYSCDSTSNANCITNVALITELAKCTDATGCYTQTDDAGKVTRGCLPAEQKCEGTNCKSCKEDKCNNNKICKSCNSETNADCAQTDSQGVSNAICDKPDSKCVVKVDAEKFTTVRGCASDDDLKSCNNTNCKTCDDGNCNVGIFPLNRVRCFQCASTEPKCTDVITNTDIKSLPCRLYKADDQCYMFSTEQANMQRGCVSDTVDTNKCKTPASNELCANCSTDNCNSLLYKNSQRLMCITCNGAEDTSCAWGHSANSAQSCKNQIEYNKRGQCYTQTINNVVHRGCLYDRDTATCSAENNCETCSVGDGCNFKDSGVFSCIRCRSDALSTCRNNADKIGGTPCRNAVTADTNKCFHGIWHDVVIRGCMVDADDSMQRICNDAKNKQCTVCEGENCNREKTSGAASLLLATELLAALLVTLWQLR